MKRLGLVLALLVLGSLFVGVGAVSALTWENTGIYVKFGDTTVLMPVLTYDYTGQGYYFGYWAQDRQSFKITLVLANGTNITATDADFVASYTATSDGYEVYLEKLNLTLTEGQIKAIKWQEFAGTAFTEEFNVLYGGIATYILNDENPVTFSISPHTGVIGYIAHAYTDWGTTKAGDIKIDDVTVSGADYNFNLIKFTKDEASSVSIARVSGLSTGVIVAFGEYPFQVVTFNIKDALTGQSLTGVTVKEDGQVLGTIDDGGTLELTRGTHELTFEKSGYWSKTLTIDVQSDTSVNVELYPDNYVIMASSQVSDVYQYSQGVATLQVSVVNGSGYGYSTKVAISGVEVSKVTWNGGVVNPGDDGSYYLGDIGSSPGELKIYFKAGDVLGDRSFRVTFTTYDSLANMKANEYMITYTVQEPPFKVTLPSWKVGVNTVRVTDQSGTDRVISIILYDENGTEVYSDSQSLLSYGSVEFNVPINALDGYLLEVRSNDGISLYFDVTAQVPIVLKTETVQVSGSTGEITVEISNSGNSVAYYKLIVEGEPIDNSTQAVEVSLAPGETKTVQVPFKLRDGLTLENYEATIKALDSSDTVVWSSTFIIKRSSGFALPISGVSSEDALGLGALALLGAGGLVVIMKKKRRE